MTGIVIVAHTPVASAMLGFAEHTFGVLPERVRAVDIPNPLWQYAKCM